MALRKDGIRQKHLLVLMVRRKLHNAHPPPRLMPVEIGSTWSLNHNNPHPHHNASPYLPSRPSHGLSAYPSSQWQDHFPATGEESQGWHTEPPTLAVPPGEPSYAYNTSQGQASPSINPGWDSRPGSSSQDTTAWGVNYNRMQTSDQGTGLKPPLPVGTFYVAGLVPLQSQAINLELLRVSSLSIDFKTRSSLARTLVGGFSGKRKRKTNR